MESLYLLVVITFYFYSVIGSCILPDCTECQIAVPNYERYYIEDTECNYTIIKSLKKIINPYKEDIQNYVPTKPFGNFRLKCAVCLAIADQVDKTIREVVNKYNDDTLKEAVKKDIQCHMQSLCSDGFRNYDVHNFQGVTLLTNMQKCGLTKAEGSRENWTKKLRDMCKMYAEYLDMKKLGDNYLNNPNYNITEQLCRSSGIFRDCLNLEDKTSTIEHKICMNTCSELCTCQDI